MFYLRKESNGDVSSKDKRLWEEDDDDDNDQSDFNLKRTRTDLSTETGTVG
jgi:hypothetical protein